MPTIKPTATPDASSDTEQISAAFPFESKYVDVHGSKMHYVDVGEGGGPFEGMPMILVTMTGAKSGRELCSPLVHSTDGEDPIIVAAQGGAPENPNWYYNLVANPQITVEIGTDKWEGTAHLTERGERRRLFDAQVAQIPQLAEYERNTAPREIPVFRITRN